MSDMQDDRRFEEFLQREATEYNRPPNATPRDEMWEIVARARSGARTSDRSAVGRAAAGSRSAWRYAPWIGMAATLLIGIGLGRVAMREDAAPAGVAAAPVATPAVTAGSPDSGRDSVDPTAVVAGAVVRQGTEGAAAVPGTGGATQRVGPARNVAAGRAAGVEAPAGGSNGDAGGTAYAMASRDHLTRAEALVAVVATMPADAMMDSLMGRWARDVLTNTRLLLDSPAGEDPIRRRLLEDLETLLVQLVQRSGRAAEERELIDRTLQRTQLLTRLRSGAIGS